MLPVLVSLNWTVNGTVPLVIFAVKLAVKTFSSAKTVQVRTKKNIITRPMKNMFDGLINSASRGTSVSPYVEDA